jgi:hypothetical protein
MTSMVAVASPAGRDRIARRVGQFATGMFAGICAAFAPRLTLMIGPPASSGAVNLDAFQTTYVVSALAFSVLIGGVVVILEWDGTRGPRDTFMAALGVPALLTGVFSTANLADEAVRQAERVKSISDQRILQEGIPVIETPQASLEPTSGGWLPGLQLTTPVFAHELTRQAEPPRQAAGLGVRYREPRYWVVLAEAASQRAADDRVAEIDKKYGALSVYKVGESYFVCPAGGTFPYSEAVSKAVELKQQSRGALSPKLVRVAE